MPELRAGDVLAGKYAIRRCLGEGSFGEVYEALHQRLDRTVALKIVNRAGRQDHETAALFLQEGRAQARLIHEHIVPIHDADECEFGGQTIPFLIMEYLPGGSLQQLLKARGALGVAEGCCLAQQVAEALAHAAAQTPVVVHRDVKPLNVMLSDDGVAKLGDFGLAKLLSTSVALNSRAWGTPAYMSPEQCRSGTDLGPSTDVYALGCVLYALVSGQPPFGQGPPGPLYHAHTNEVPERLSTRADGVPAWLDQLVARTLAKEAGARPTAAEVADELERHAEAADPTAQPLRPAGSPGLRSPTGTVRDPLPDDSTAEPPAPEPAAEPRPMPIPAVPQAERAGFAATFRPWRRLGRRPRVVPDGLGLRAPSGAGALAQAREVARIDWSGDGHTVLVEDIAGRLVRYELGAHQEVEQLLPALSFWRMRRISFRYSPETGLLCADAGGKSEVRLLNLPARTSELAAPQGRQGNWTLLSISPQWGVAASRTHEGKLQIWHLDTGRLLTVVPLAWHESDCWLSPWRFELLLHGVFGGVVVDLRSGARTPQRQPLDLPPRWLTSLAGSHSRAGDAWRLVRLQPFRREAPWRVYSILNMASVGEAVLAGSPTVAAVADDGSRLFAGYRDGTIGMHDLRGTGPAELLQGHPSAVTALWTSADGRLLVSGDRDGNLRTWHLGR